MADIIKKIKDECERIEEDALYSSKGHFNTEARWEKAHWLIGIPMTVFAAWAGIDVFKSNLEMAGYLALISASLAAINTVLNPDRKAAKHGVAARDFNELKNKVRIFKNIDLPTIKTEEAQQKIEALSNLRSELNKNSPGIPKWAFKKARKGIEEGESHYESDGQIE